MLVYDVLYYKRPGTLKKHRDKGVSKYDGILRIDPDTSRITLENMKDKDALEDSVLTREEEMDVTSNLSWNQKRQRLQQKTTAQNKVRNNHLLYSGIQQDIASRKGFLDDEVIVLGGYEVQISGLRIGKQTVSKTSNIPFGKQTRRLNVATLQKQPLQQEKQEHSVISNPIKTTNVIRKVAQPLQSKRSVVSSTLFVRRLAPQPLQSKQINMSNTSSQTCKKRVASAIAHSSKMIRPKSSEGEPVPIDVLPHIPLPARIRNILRPHQVEGVDFLWKTLHEKSGCILGDEMGLGKTLMTISILIALHRNQRDKQFVVVCPSSLVRNWADEFDKWLGRASQPKRVIIQKGGEECLNQIRAYTSSMKQQLTNHTGQVLIVSYDIFRRNSKEFVFPENASVGLLVVDEGHRLKSNNGSMTLAALQALPADARLCITATPIQNNLCEFFNLASFCCPGILGDDLAYFRETYERPILAANQKNVSHAVLSCGIAKSKELEAISSTFMIRRLQKDVLKTALPPRTEVLLFCRPSLLQRELYNEITSNISSSGKMFDALPALTSLRKICCHPRLYENDVPSEHIEDSVSLSGKLSVLESMLQQIRTCNPNDKVVIVSNFTSALSIIESSILEPRQFSYLRLDGNTAAQNRQSLVDTFNRTTTEHSFCFLLSAKAGGCGLNLIGANRLVMFDNDWNPSTDIQSMGRVYRTGQTKPCFIYRLFTSGTLEEVIFQRQRQKAALSELTVDGEGKQNSKASSVTKFSKEELKDCFTLKACACDTKWKLGKRWPEYTGADRLRELGCCDQPLLNVAGTMDHIVTFIHISNDDEALSICADSDVDMNCDKTSEKTTFSDESSESENEFVF